MGKKTGSAPGIPISSLFASPIRTFRSPTGADWRTQRLGQCLAIASLLLLSLMLTSCGALRLSDAQDPTSQSGDFTLSASPGSASLNNGSTTSVSISATAINGFSSAVSVTVSGLPSGVIANPAHLTVTPGSSTTVRLSASSGAAAGNATLVFTGSSGGVIRTADVSLQVGSGGGGSSLAATRTRYVRTDAVEEYTYALNSSWIIYHRATGNFLVTDAGLGKVTALSAATQKVVGSVSVPGAYGISQTVDGSIVYVGTTVGDVYAIDPTTLTVTHRYLAANIGPFGYHAISAQALANGALALLGTPGGIASVDGTPSFAFWNPTYNTIQIYTTAYGASQMYGVPYTVICGPLMGNIGLFELNASRTKVIIGSIFSDGTLCEIDGPTRAVTYTQPGYLIRQVAVTPDGKHLVLTAGWNGNPMAMVLDADTLTQVALFPIRGDNSSAASFFVSADSSTLYTSSNTEIYAYNLGTHEQMGWFPNITVMPRGGGGNVGPIGPNMQAVDTTGLIAGPLEEGVGFLDTFHTLHTGPVGTQFTNGYLQPPYGAPSGGTQVLWQGGTNAAAVAGFYLGGKRVTSLSSASGGVSFRTPGGSGPADFYAFMNDGGMQLLPEAYNYGPTILQVTENESSTDGGGTAYIFGYGFGPTTQPASVPSDIKVTVGGIQATVLNYTANVYGIVGQPFLLEAVGFKVPAGTGTQNVTISNSSGSATANGAITYIPAPVKFAAPGAALAQGIYDPHRDVYYFSDASQIRVFSRTQGQWLAPIPITPPAGKVARLWGLGLSPDGTKLAVADISANALYVLDPDSPSAVTTYIVPASLNFGQGAVAVAVAISDSDMLYVATRSGSGGHDLFKYDPGANTWKDYQVSGGGAPNQQYLRVIISSDNAHVYFNMDGQPFIVDTATDKVAFTSVAPGCCYGDYELTLSRDDATVSATAYFYDAALGAQALESLNIREIASGVYVYGAKLNGDGALLFQPSPNGIDVIDAKRGTLVDRIALSISLSPNYDALVADGNDNVLVAITGNAADGIAVLDLTSIPDPVAPYAPVPRSIALSQGFISLPQYETSLSTSGKPLQKRPKAQPLHAPRSKHVTTPQLLPGGMLPLN